MLEGGPYSPTTCALTPDFGKTGRNLTWRVTRAQGEAPEYSTKQKNYKKKQTQRRRTAPYAARGKKCKGAYPSIHPPFFRAGRKGSSVRLFVIVKTVLVE